MLSAHVGRNDACPCGSGQRYKECHGRLHSPDDAEGSHAAGLLDLARGDYASALVKIGNAVAMRPLRAQFHVSLARAQLGSGLRRPAVESARRAIEIDADDASAWTVLGSTLEAAEPEEALAAWQRAV